MKEYKTNEELIEHLESKRVIIDNKVDNMYLKNVHFNEIYSLYNFDKNIRSIFLKYVLEFELKIRGVMSNTFAKNYGIENCFHKNSFDENANENDIDNLIESIHDEITKNKGKHPAITHYDEAYGFIPPFVSIKILSFGQISRLYGLLKQSDRNEIAKKFKINSKLLKQILVNMTMVRNICAHSDRLFTFHSKFFMSFKLIDSTYKMNNCSTNLYMLIRCMEKFLNKNEYDNLIKSFNNEYIKLRKNIKSINTNVILKIMGYPNV